jgi:hypothetical protein
MVLTYPLAFNHQLTSWFSPTSLQLSSHYISCQLGSHLSVGNLVLVDQLAAQFSLQLDTHQLDSRTSACSLILTNRFSLISWQLGSHQQVLTDQLAAWFSPTSQQLGSHQVAENQIRTNQLAGEFSQISGQSWFSSTGCWINVQAAAARKTNLNVVYLFVLLDVKKLLNSNRQLGFSYNS